MAPSSSVISAQLRQIVYYHLDNLSYDNALFYAERLVAYDPRTSESVHLLALSHFRLGDYQSAYEISKAVGHRGGHLGCAFLFAQTCLVLERYKEGISALERARASWSGKSGFGKHGATTKPQQPDSATVFCLLGKLYRGRDEKKKSIMNFEEALKANPFMWDAFTALCDMGVNVRTQNIFKANDSLFASCTYDMNNGVLAEQKDNAAAAPVETVNKRSYIRQHIAVESADPFDSQKVIAASDSLFGNSSAPFSSGENEFLSKIAAARSRMAVPAVEIGTDFVETPTTSTSDTNARGLAPHPEQPQIPARKTRGFPTDAALQDPSLKTGHRLGMKRVLRAYEKAHDDAPADSNSGALRIPSIGASGIERKRTVSGHPVHPRQQLEEPGAPQRRSARINMSKNPVVKTHTATNAAAAAPARELKKARPPIPRLARPISSSTTVGRAVSGNRKPLEENGMDVDHAEAPRVREPVVHQPVPKQIAPDSAKVEEALRYIMDLLRKLATGYLAQSQYQSLEALTAYTSLPRGQQDTPWVLSQMGRANYEQAAYAEAEKYYRRLRILAPTRFEDMEVYSTILWFLKRETELSFLAHELVDACWQSPQAWCALGNAWSLARDHEQALRCFKRATQLDPKFAYAFTLQGHEHVSNEEYEKALTAYRRAISADRRHYNAYYGIGRVYEKLGNYDMAYTHFHSASVINPTNAVLICCIGNVLEKQRQIVPALQYFTKATELAPQAAQTRYKKARALLALNQLDAARKELEILKNLAPDEATVHFLLGKLYKTLNDKGAAVRHFTIALNLDPKASQQIKEAIESLEEDDDGYDDSMMG
ncbi:anaphase-promoting complex subunit 3 [Microdochium nivale]|nr:anaphase-promoting complex subunit 3 [Microdochium nivale]